MRVSAEAQRVHIAQADLAVELNRFQEQHNLSDVEMLQAVNRWEGTLLKYALRAERHPDDPDKGSDEP